MQNPKFTFFPDKTNTYTMIQLQGIIVSQQPVEKMPLEHVGWLCESWNNMLDIGLWVRIYMETETRNKYCLVSIQEFPVHKPSDSLEVVRNMYVETWKQL